MSGLPKVNDKIVGDLLAAIESHRSQLEQKEYYQAYKILRQMLILYCQMTVNDTDRLALLDFYKRGVVKPPAKKSMSADEGSFQKSEAEIVKSMSADGCITGDCNEYWKNTKKVRATQSVVSKSHNRIEDSKSDVAPEVDVVTVVEEKSDLELVLEYEDVMECTSAIQVAIFFSPKNKHAPESDINKLCLRNMIKYAKTVDHNLWNKVKGNNSVASVADHIFRFIETIKEN